MGGGAGLKKVVDRLGQTFSGGVLGVEEFRGQPSIRVSPQAYLEICGWLIEDERAAFNFLTDLTAVDWFPEEPRFEVVLHLYSHQHNWRLRLKVPVSGAAPALPTVTGLWPTANWHERECYDMFGIRFEHHPDLRRILMPETYPFHPLRKDFPLEGIEPEKYIFDRD